MRVVLTGGTGFVGPHVVAALRQLDPACEVIVTARTAGCDPGLGEVEALDVLDGAAIRHAIARHRPTHIIHLAGIAAPQRANADWRETWQTHVEGTLGLGRAVLEVSPDCWLVHVGSGLAYGGTARVMPLLDETALLDPLDDYGASKAAADLGLGALARRGLKCLRMRPFNHTGPGQSVDFAAPAFAMQIARIEAGLAPAVVRVGNLDAARDFLDVRDVAMAYALAAQRSQSLEPGLILNVGSGRPRRMSEVLSTLLSMSSVPIATEQDPARMRPSDVPSIAGDAARARKMLGWEPRIGFEDMLAGVLDDCRERVRRAKPSA